MTDQYLTTVLEAAERVAAHHNQVAQSSDNPYHEYLRYTVLRLLEGETDEMSVDVPQIDCVTVGYGQDEAMYETWGDDVEWWETVPPQEERTRFRVFYPSEYEIVPRGIVNVMAALGAWRVWTGSAAVCGSYDHHERREAHYLWPEGLPVENLLQDRLHGSAAGAPDGGRTGDIRDRMVVTEDSPQRDDLEPRTRRAIDEEMAVSLLEKGGRYEVRSASGNRYEVDVVAKSCTCPDWDQFRQFLREEGVRSVIKHREFASLDAAHNARINNETYHRRSVVESVFASLRRRFNDTIRARTWFGQFRELVLKAAVKNIEITIKT